jgi:PAS domain S-box-containing protein
LSDSSGHFVSPRKLVWLCSGLVAAIGLTGLSGWIFDITALKNISPNLPIMVPNTAFGMLLCGIVLSFLAITRDSERIRQAAGIPALLAALLGSLTLTEYISGRDLAVDRLFNVIGRVHGNLGRMSPASALCFAFAGLALFCASLPLSTRWRSAVAGALGAAILMFGAVTVIAYVCDLALHLHFWNYTGVAIHTAAGFTLVGGGILAALGSDGVAQWSLNPGTTAGVLVGVLCLVSTSMVANDFTYRLQHDAFLVSHTREVINTVETIASGTTDLENAQRGFLIIGDEHLLDRRETGKLQVQKNLAAFRNLTLDNSQQQLRADQLAVLIALRNAWGDKTIAARRESGFAEAQRLVSTNTGIALSDRIREVLAQMRAEEYALLAVREQKSSITADKTFLLLPLGTILSLSLVFLALFFLNAGNRERARVERSLRVANEHLRSTEERFRLLISGVREYAIFLLDAEGRVATWNPGAQQLKLYSSEEIVGQYFSRFYTPEAQAAQRPQRALEIARETGRYEEEGWRVRKDGTRFWADVLITAVRDDHGNSVGFAKVTRDRPEHQRIQQTLQEDEARLAAVIGSAMDAVITVDEEQHITLFNPAAERMFGRSLDSVLGRPLEQLMPERFRAKHSGHIRDFARTNASRRKMGALAPIYGVRSSGEEFAIEASISQALVGGRRIFSVILRDISERNRAEDELRQQARLLDLVPVLVRDMRNHIVLWSSAVEKIYGYSASEALGTISHELLKTAFPAPVEQIERELLEKGTWEGELIHRTRAGEKVIVNSRWVLYRDAQGTAVRILEVSDDITERKHAEAQQARSQKLESLGTLSGGIAHDFNNILLAVGGNAQLAIADLPPDHPVQQSLREIARGAARATDLVRRILAFSRPQEMKREAMQLQPVVEEALKLVRATIPATIEFRTTFTSGLPAVLADPTQLHQIIVNLATNASHAIGSRSDGVIQVQLDRVELANDDASSALQLAPGKYVRLLVSDNGSGMDRATVDRIFDPFFTTKGPGEGTGLGLSVVHGIMKNHSGGISVYSELGRGTAFRLYFPRTAVAVEVAKEAPKEEVRQRSERILYVDDEEALVALVKRTLERLGYKVTGLCNPLRAVKLFREDPAQFDAVVTDLAMPQLSGFDMSQQMLGIRADIPIVMTSGYVRPEDQERALSLGLRDLILKPDTIEQLARTLDQVFQHEPASVAIPTKPLKG